MQDLLSRALYAGQGSVTNGAQNHLPRMSILIMLFLHVLPFTGCATYRTPGKGVPLSTLADPDVRRTVERKPTATFPTILAIVRIQAASEASFNDQRHGAARFSTATVSDFEQEQHLELVNRLPLVAAVLPLNNRLLFPATLESDRELRLAAASLRADMVLVYTLDTSFRVDQVEISPLAQLLLGFLPDREAVVTSNASAVLYDAKTGFVYGVVEATARENRIASTWTSRSAVENTRIKAEANAFERLMDQFLITWSGIVREYARNSNSNTGDRLNR